MKLHTRTAGTGPPLVLLHGFPLSSAMWLAQRAGLAEGRQVITPDLRGFGGSKLGDDEPSVDAMADDVAELLDALSLDKAVVGGLSMGGYVTMALARRHPERLSGVILANTKASADSPEAAENRETVAQSLLDGGDLLESVPNLLGTTSLEKRGMVVGRVRGLVGAAPAQAAAWAQRAMAARPDSFDTLRALNVPTLVIVGDEDKLTPPGDAEAMAKVLPDGRLVVINRAGHLSAIETPETFNRAVSGFLTEIG
ncbi:alpha/beta fold hydrolase [Herbidospora mongoliensis]|uniref:alpha/beta fold hydrolase n=1 Tax=Herbidospora mongoliensis TaxID=688067 RepID=UPI000836A893|nr:alpha/beta hydrolase [Herbidospora mongoliensis]